MSLAERSGAEQVPSTQLLDQLVRKPQQESDTRACECFIIALPLVSAHVYNQTKSILIGLCKTVRLRVRTNEQVQRNAIG